MFLLAQAATTTNPSSSTRGAGNKTGRAEFPSPTTWICPTLEIKTRNPGAPPTIAADWQQTVPSQCSSWERQSDLSYWHQGALLPPVPADLPNIPCSTQEHSSATARCWGGGLCLTVEQARWRVGFPLVLHTEAALPEGGRAACLPKANTSRLSKQHSHRRCCSSRHFSLAGMTIQRQPQH